MPLPDADAPRWTLPVAAITVATVYLATCARAVLGGDNGEFATLFAEGGVAHPSGYPLYTLWLRAWSWLPASSPAHGAALATALTGALAAAALLFATRAWGASRHGALFALASWAFASLPWRLSTHAEVFAPNAALALVIAGLSGPAAPVRGTSRAVLLGLTAGLGLANHLSIVLLAPLGLYAAVKALRESERPARTALFAVAALLPGLCTYASLLYVARHAGDRLVWGDTATMRGLVDHVLRRDFGTTQLSASGAGADAWGELWFFLRRAMVDLKVLPAVLGVVGFTALEGDRTHAVTARDRGAFGAALVLAGPLFLARFNIPPSGVGAAVVERFHLLPESLLAVMAARGFDLVAERAPLGASVQRGLAAAVALVGLALAWTEVRDDHRDTVERYLLDTLDTLPPNAVILATGDHRTLGFPYVQRALGRRRDVLHIDPRLLPLAHYRRRVERRLGRPFPFPPTQSIPTVLVAEAALATGRPVFLGNVFTAAIPRAFPTYPMGTVLRVLPRETSPPPPEVLVRLNDTLYRGYRVRPGREALAPWQSVARAEYPRAWQSLAEVALAAHRPDIAEALRARAEAYTPLPEAP